MKFLRLLFICAATFAGCASVPVLPLACETPTGIDLLPRSGLVVFGEIHGTNVAPKFVSTVACASAQMGNRVVVAIEWPEDLQTRLDERLLGQVSNSIAIKSTAFVSMNEDGRASTAMLALVEDIASMRASGHRVSVAAFDVGASSKLGVNETRDQTMANNLRAIAGKNTDALILVLSGNIHSRKQRGTPWNSALEPMAFLLRDLGLISLNVAYDDGAASVCTGGGKCGSRAFKGNARLLDLTSRSPMIAMDSRVEAHDGYFYVGKLTASAPVR